MPRASSVDLRERVLRAHAAGHAATEIVRMFQISRSTLARWQTRTTRGESLTPGQSSGRPRRLTPDQDDLVRHHVDAHPDATIAELGAWWAATHHVPIGWTTMWRVLDRIDRPLKKESDRDRTQ